MWCDWLVYGNLFHGAWRAPKAGTAADRTDFSLDVSYLWQRSTFSANFLSAEALSYGGARYNLCTLYILCGVYERSFSSQT